MYYSALLSVVVTAKKVIVGGRGEIACRRYGIFMIKSLINYRFDKVKERTKLKSSVSWLVYISFL